MKAGIIEKPGVLKIADIPEPQIQSPTDVKIKIKRAGICGSDMHIMHGTNTFAVYPIVWGHEATGEVLEVGSDVTDLKPGDHVVTEPIRYCGECYACKKGRRNACHSLKVMGVHFNGAAQEYCVLPRKNVYLIPSQIPWSQAVLVEPFTIGAQACYRGQVEAGDVVFIMGAGTIGLTIMLNAKLLGATVIISDIYDDKLNYAKKLGADYTINASGIDVVEKIKELTGGYGANVVVDAVCSVKSFEQAIDCTGSAGRIVEMSFNKEPSGIAALKLAAKELTVLGSRHQTNRFPVVIDYLKAGKLPLEGFVNAEYPFSKMAEAFAYADTNAATVRKIIINFDE